MPLCISRGGYFFFEKTKAQSKEAQKFEINETQRNEHNLILTTMGSQATFAINFSQK